jgi:hypothetical protein
MEILSDAFFAAAEKSALGILIAVFQIAPPVLVTVLIVWIFSKLMKVDDDASIILYGSAFGFIGLIIAYLYSDRGQSFISGLLPQFIAAITLAFQLVGRMKSGWKVPIESQATVIAAAATAFCFLFGSIYFETLRSGGRDGSALASEREETSSDGAGQLEKDLGPEGINDLLNGPDGQGVEHDGD